MAMSAYLSRLRAAVGTDLVVLPAVTGVVYGEGGAVLLVHQRDFDLWSTPGGLVEPHEPPADAVFECVVRGGSLTAQSDEVDAVAFDGPADLPNYRLTPWAARLLPSLFQPTGGATFDAPT